MIKRLFKSIREYKLSSILTFIFILGEAVIECIIPFITAKLINRIELGSEMGDLIKTGVLLVVMAMASLACGGIAGVTCSKASSGFAKNLRHDIFSKVQTYSFENIDKFSSSSLVTRLTTDVSNVQMAYMMIIRTAIRAPLMLIFSVIMAYVMGGSLATLFVIIIPVLVIGLFIISIEENVRGMRVVKGFAREDYEKKKFGIAAGDICKDFTKAERIVALNSPLMQICVYFNMAFILIVGSKLIITSAGSSLGVGEMSSMLTYGFQILMQLMMLAMIYVMLTMSGESMARIVEVLDEESALTNAPAKTVTLPDGSTVNYPLTEIKDGSIDFDDVSFKYSKTAKKNSLSDINLHIKSGMTVGILGGTGTGKSSLVQLIPRLYDVTEGCVKVAGNDVRDYDLEALRDSVAFVLQKNLLFSGTIKDNLRWGNENATDEEMIKACRLAQADEFIRSFPDGYDTKIEQGGSNVSGGQKQRLCIARALLKKPKILILDDSTSAVDMKTDALIRAGFKSFIPETTKIIIAQRIASVMDADLIVVMENGKIAESGTHDELMASSEIYRETYTQQMSGGEDNE